MKKKKDNALKDNNKHALEVQQPIYITTSSEYTPRPDTATQWPYNIPTRELVKGIIPTNAKEADITYILSLDSLCHPPTPQNVARVAYGGVRHILY